MIQSIEDIIEPRLRAAGHLGSTEQVRVFQYAYSTSTSASGNTHAGGGSLDHKKGNDAETKIWRQCGVADWQRGTPQDPFFSDHNHGIWQGCPHLSAAAKRQIVEYRNGDDGLAGDGSDDSPRVAPITWQAAYDKYKSEEDMPLSNDDIDRIWDRVTVENVWGVGTGTKVQADSALRLIGRDARDAKDGLAEVREQLAEILKRLPAPATLDDSEGVE